MTASFIQRGPMKPISREVRAYFAPVARALASPSIFDAAKDGQFPLSNPPVPWIDAGWIKNFARSASTKTIPLNSGNNGSPLQQYRSALSATVTFEFREWGKLQMAISAGSQHINLLVELFNDSQVASGGIPVAPVATFSGSTAVEIFVGAGVVDSFSVGDIIAVDVDYAQQTGFVGSGIAGAFVKSSTDVQSDANYIRKITFNVARVTGKTLTSVLLGQPLVGGAPPAGAQVQKVKGFVDREGGSFFQEWSGLFVCESETGARILYYYPRLQAAVPTKESAEEVDHAFDVWSLPTKLVALATKDPIDNEQVLCYRSFIPASNAAIY